MKEKDSFILDIKRLGIKGEGIGFYNRMAVFVENAIPNEGHNVEVMRVEKNMVFARSLEIKRVSPHRVTPACKHFGKCKSCNVMHIDYPYALKLKRELLIEALNRYSHLNYKRFEIKDILPLQENLHQKRYAEFIFKKDEKIEALVKGSFVPYEECLLLNTSLKELCRKIVELAEKLQIPLFHTKFRRGVLKGVRIALGENGEALVVLNCFEKNRKTLDLAKQIKELPNVVGVYEAYEDNECNLLEGQGYILTTYDRLKVRYYPNNDFSDCAKKFELVLKALKLSRKESVLCNSAILSLNVSYLSKEAVGIEYDKTIILQAQEMIKENRLRNVEVLQGEFSNLGKKLQKERKFDCLVLDAKKFNLDEETMQFVLSTNATRIVYISFNPSALARDLEVLSSKYKVNYIASVDVKPESAIAESIVSLTYNEPISLVNE